MSHIIACCGPTPMDEDNAKTGVYYHAVGKQKDLTGQLVYQNDMMQTLWEYSIIATKGDTIKAIPDPKTYQSFEYNEGAKQLHPSFPIAGFENSLYYRKVQFSEALASQMPEHQLKAIKNKFPIRRTWYSNKDCEVELKFHLQWRNSSKEFPLNKAKLDPGSPDDYTWETIKDTPHYPKMCAQYLEAVMNTPISIKDLNLSISLDNFERKRQLRQTNSVVMSRHQHG